MTGHKLVCKLCITGDVTLVSRFYPDLGDTETLSVTPEEHDRPPKLSRLDELFVLLIPCPTTNFSVRFLSLGTGAAFELLRKTRMRAEKDSYKEPSRDLEASVAASL